MYLWVQEENAAPGALARGPDSAAVELFLQCYSTLQVRPAQTLSQQYSSASVHLQYSCSVAAVQYSCGTATSLGALSCSDPAHVAKLAAAIGW
jgi:hypothetical protein